VPWRAALGSIRARVQSLKFILDEFEFGLQRRRLYGILAYVAAHAAGT